MSNQPCPVTKNEIYPLEIHALGSNGEGIGRIDGYTLFVDGAIIGDHIMAKVMKAKKNYGFARLVEIVKPSDNRIEPVCPVARQCGGCSLQQMRYKAQLEYKVSQIKDNLERIGGLAKEHIDASFEGIIGADDPFYYRNKVQFPVRDEHGQICIGFYAKHSHRIVETPRCYIQDIYNEQIVEVIRNYMVDYGVSAYNEQLHKGLVRHLVIRNTSDRRKFQVTVVINGDKLPHEEALIEAMKKLDKVENLNVNVNRERTNVIMGRKLDTLYGEAYLTDDIKDIAYQISPLSFYQVNPEQTTKLYEKALDYAELTGHERVYDLYCGIGTISLFLAQKAKEVHGVEIIPQAIEDARDNAVLNQIDNVFFHVGKSEDIMPRLYKEEGIQADVVVVDPPRKGCEASLIETIATMAPERVIYVSCDPATLARDVKLFDELGYRVDKVTGVDMFPMTTHVETCLSLKKIR